MNKELSHFRGLPPWFKATVVAISLASAIACIGVALSYAGRSNERLQYRAEEDGQDLRDLYQMGRTDTQSDVYLFAHILNVQAHLKGISNKHSLAMIAISSGLALYAIGFSLFVIGADGAFELIARSGGGMSAAATGTAPGLLCFIAATVVISIGVTRKHSLMIGEFNPPFVVERGASRSPSAERVSTLAPKVRANDQRDWAARQGTPSAASDRAMESMFGGD